MAEGIDEEAYPLTRSFPAELMRIMQSGADKEDLLRASQSVSRHASPKSKAQDGEVSAKAFLGALWAGPELSSSQQDKFSYIPRRLLRYGDL